MTKILIRQYPFSVADPFKQGHSLTLEEAQALNALRAENIRNNVSKIVVAETSKLLPGEFLGPAAIHELQQRIEQYASRYKFPLRFPEKVRLSPLEAAIRELAQEKLNSQLAGQGDLGISELETEEMLAEISQQPDIQALARERLARKQDILHEAVEDL